MENKGYIYKITNKINGKMYVGQTKNSIKTRFYDHKRNSKDPNKPNYYYPLYKAFRKYGIENFEIEELECCDISLLNERETYYIEKYDTYNNGYNCTLGGGGKQMHNFNEQEIIEKYKKNPIIMPIANEYNCADSTIKKILEKNNVEIISAPEQAKRKGISTIQKDLNGNVMNEFSTLIEAAKWVKENNLSKYKKLEYISNFIKWHIIHETPIFGYVWESDYYTKEQKEILKSNEKEYKQNFRKNNYKKEKNKRYDLCPLCNQELKLKTSKVCEKCFFENKKYIDYTTNTNSKEDVILHPYQNQHITRDELKNLIRTTSFLQIGKQFGVSDNAIRKWCKNYELPYKSTEIKKYTNEEWDNI